MIDEIYYKIITIILVLIIFLIRIPYTRKQIFNKRQILKGVIILVVIILYLLPVFNFANLRFDLWIRLMGLIIYSLGLILIAISHHYLGKNWHPLMDVKNSKNLNIVHKGPYKYIRHPIYLSWFIIIIGLGIFTSNILFFAVPFIIYLIIYINGVNKEEKILLKKFGNKYKVYMSNVGRFFPRIMKK